MKLKYVLLLPSHTQSRSWEPGARTQVIPLTSTVMMQLTPPTWRCCWVRGGRANRRTEDWVLPIGAWTLDQAEFLAHRGRWAAKIRPPGGYL